MAAAEPDRHHLVAGAEAGVVGFDLQLQGFVQGAVAGRHRIVGGALEHRQVRRLLGDDGDGLNGGGAGADDAHPLAGEIHLLVRPVPGVEGLPLKTLDALEVRGVGGGQAAGGHDQKAGGNSLPPVRANHPAAGRLVVGGGDDAGVEFDVPAQVEAVGHMIGVLQDFRLRGVALRPAPLLLQRLRELIGVLQALHIATGTWVAVPVPGAAHPAATLEDAGGEPEPPQPMQHVQAGEAGAHQDGVQGPVRASHEISPILMQISGTERGRLGGAQSG